MRSEGVADRRGAEPAGGELAREPRRGVRGAGQEAQGLHARTHPLRARQQPCAGLRVQGGARGQTLAGEHLGMEHKKRAVGEMDADHLSGGSLELDRNNFESFPGRVSGDASVVSALPLGELEPAPGSRLSVLLPLHHAGITREEPIRAKRHVVGRVVRVQRPGDAVAARLDLRGDPAAADGDEHVELARCCW